MKEADFNAASFDIADLRGGFFSLVYLQKLY